MCTVADDEGVAYFLIDGAPYIDPEWLQRRIYRDSARIKRWHQEARCTEWLPVRVAPIVEAAYMSHAREASYRVEKWRKNLAATLAAIASHHRDARAEFGLLVKERRVSAGMTLKELARLSGLDDKTIKKHRDSKFHGYAQIDFPVDRRAAIENVLGGRRSVYPRIESGRRSKAQETKNEDTDKAQETITSKRRKNNSTSDS